MILLTVPERMHNFGYVKGYPDFNAFESDVRLFLTKEKLSLLCECSFGLACSHSWLPEVQKVQTAAINRVLSKMYGSGVKWAYNEDRENEEKIWGLWININNEEHCLYQNLDLTVDEFIRLKLEEKQ